MQKLFTRLSSVLIIAVMVTLCCTDGESLFEVIVVDSEGMPVARAWIEGGIDWDWYRVYTNSDGVAYVPERGYRQPAWIYKGNYLPRHIDELRSAMYVIEPTSHRLREIGEVKGKAVYFDNETVVTVDGSAYYLYAYDDQGVTLASSDALAASVNEFKLLGDILWFSTYEDGIYGYSLENLSQPQFLIHVEIPGYLDVFAVKDSIIVVGPQYGAGALRIFSFDNTGGVQQLISISEFTTKAMEFIGNYLIVVGGEQSMPTVFDLVDPARPVLVYNHYEPNAYTGFIRDTMLIVVPDPYVYDDYVYKYADLSSPWSPFFQGSFTADALLYDLIDGEYAVGRCASLYAGCVLSGHFDLGFTTVAVLPDPHYPLYGGSYPPYFLFDDRLWILEEN
jgi:hypothetical protein